MFYLWSRSKVIFLRENLNGGVNIMEKFLNEVINHVVSKGFAIRNFYLKGKITAKEAKKHLRDFIKFYNDYGRKNAKTHRKAPKKFSFKAFTESEYFEEFFEYFLNYKLSYNNCSVAL